jgi:hypothetical protein
MFRGRWSAVTAGWSTRSSASRWSRLYRWRPRLLPQDIDEWLIVLNSGDASVQLRRWIQLVPSLCARWESIRTTIGSYGKSLYREGRLRARRTSSSSLMCGWQWRSPARNFGSLAARNLGFLSGKNRGEYGIFIGQFSCKRGLETEQI